MPPKRKGSRDEAAASDNANQSAFPDNDQLDENVAQKIDRKLDFIINELKEIRSDVDEIKSEQKDIIKSIENCSERISDNKKTITEQGVKIDTCIEDLASAKSEIAKLRNELDRANSEIAGVQQYSRKDCINIVGVPVQDNENIFDILKSISLFINFDFNKDMISNCHRLSGKNREMAPPIIVRFVKNIDKQKFLQCKGKKGRILASDIGWSNDARVIYINETMSPFCKSIFNKGKELQKQGHLKYVWFKNGNIFVKADDRSKSVLISRIEDFNKLVTKR